VAYFARTTAFVLCIVPGLWLFLTGEGAGAWLGLVSGFLLGGIASHRIFKQFATPEQIREDLTARLFND
jgi:hypothetical protein